MTNVRFSCIDGRLSFGAEGHAGEAHPDPGAGKSGVNPDLICAAVSILCYTLAETVKYMEYEEKTECAPTVCLTPGCCEISVFPKPDHFAEALHAFFVAETGFSVLARSFGDSVSLETFTEEAGTEDPPLSEQDPRGMPPRARKCVNGRSSSSDTQGSTP